MQSAPRARLSATCQGSTRKSLRRQGRATASRAAARKASSPWKLGPSVKTDRRAASPGALLHQRSPEAAWGRGEAGQTLDRVLRGSGLASVDLETFVGRDAGENVAHHTVPGVRSLPLDGEGSGMGWWQAAEGLDAKGTLAADSAHRSSSRDILPAPHPNPSPSRGRARVCVLIPGSRFRHSSLRPDRRGPWPRGRRR